MQVNLRASNEGSRNDDDDDNNHNTESEQQVSRSKADGERELDGGHCLSEYVCLYEARVRVRYHVPVACQVR